MQALANRAYINAHVQCDAALDVEIAHSGIHRFCAHIINVCIIKKINEPEVYRRILEMTK